MTTQEKIKEMIGLGFSAKRIANNLKLSDQETRQIIKDNNYTIVKKTFSDSEIPIIVDLYQQGVSAKQLGFIYSIAKARVQKWADEAGILRSKDDSHRITYFNYRYFDEINTPEKAYWLGFFYADAYNCNMTNTTNISLQRRDRGHIEKLADAIEMPREKVVNSFSTMNVDISENKDCSQIIEKEYPQSSMRMYSKHMCLALNKVGCPQAKSFIIKYPEWLDTNLDKHFLRGLFDGDGCLTLRIKYKEWKWSLVSTKECCEVIKQKIKQYTGVDVYYECISNTNNNTYDIEVSGNEQIKRIADWLWSDSAPLNRLDRKYDKYLDLCHQQENRAFLKSTNRTNYLIDDEMKEDIVADILGGKSIESVAKIYDVSEKTIRNYIK